METKNLDPNTQLKLHLLERFCNPLTGGDKELVGFCREAYKFLVEGDMMVYKGQDENGNHLVERLPQGIKHDGKGNVEMEGRIVPYIETSIKDRVGCEANCTTTKEWGIEDKSKVQRICKYLDEAKKYYADITEVRECIDWLKSLEDRYTWKPSDEQMAALNNAILLNEDHYNGAVLSTLREQLKKLK